MIGIFTIPTSAGPVETEFASGYLALSSDLNNNPPLSSDPTPRIDLECKPDGTVRIIRYGLQLDNAAIIALAITRKGFDLAIEERITPDAIALLSSERRPADTAIFYLTGLAHERYHISYNSASTSCFAALSLNNLPDLHTSRPLTRS